MPPRKNKEKLPKVTSHRSIELVPGFFVMAYTSPVDGAVVVEFEGAPKDDEDCENVRVYMNDGYAAEWVGIMDPRYGKTEKNR